MRPELPLCSPLPLTSPAVPAERYGYSRIVHLRAGRKLVTINSDIRCQHEMRLRNRGIAFNNYRVLLAPKREEPNENVLRTIVA